MLSRKTLENTGHDPGDAPKKYELPKSNAHVPMPPVKEPKDTSPLEMLGKLKSWLNKYGYTFDDSELGDIISNIKLKKVHVGLARSMGSDGNVYHFDNIESPAMLKPMGDVQRILVFPRGRHYIQKYDKWIEFNDAFFNQIGQSFLSEDLTSPFIDKNHELEDSFGDVIDFEITEEGMMFDIELNDKGKELVKNNVFKYISPSFGGVKDTKGQFHQNVLVSISLTNIPALMASLPALQEQIRLENKERTKMTNLTKLTSILNLQDEASVDAITAAINSLMEQGMEKDAIVAKLQEEIAKISQEKEVAEQAADEMSKELSQIKSADLEREANDVIDLAIKDGQIHPALKDLKVNQYKEKKETVIAELELLPKLDNKAKTANVAVELEDGLTEEDRKIALSAGYDISTKEGLEKYKNQVMEV